MDPHNLCCATLESKLADLEAEHALLQEEVRMLKTDLTFMSLHCIGLEKELLEAKAKILDQEVYYYPNS